MYPDMFVIEMNDSIGGGAYIMILFSPESMFFENLKLNFQFSSS